MHHFSSSVPDSITLADPLIVIEMLETAVEFICINIAARLELRPPVGLRSRSVPEVGGLLLTQSCTSKLTFGFETRFVVFLELGFVVIIIVGGPEGWNGLEGI